MYGFATLFEYLGVGAGAETLASGAQQAVKPSSNGNSKTGSASKSVRKQTVFGKMRSTIT